ncbi:hypothetical protein [Litchfieldia alkalitelluris]|uniref:hypothetical protein n=1 Tax=Litchfieldia alkalitelluris TaxID=304268 RepID=UPI00195CCB9C|nr:hypothetical protein [Litchfieldia alkalitelluris]
MNFVVIKPMTTPKAAHTAIKYIAQNRPKGMYSTICKRKSFKKESIHKIDIKKKMVTPQN